MFKNLYFMKIRLLSAESFTGYNTYMDDNHIKIRTFWKVRALLVSRSCNPNFAFFTLNSPSITQRSVSQENAFKKQEPVDFCPNFAILKTSKIIVFN